MKLPGVDDGGAINDGAASAVTATDRGTRRRTREEADAAPVAPEDGGVAEGAATTAARWFAQLNVPD